MSKNSISEGRSSRGINADNGGLRQKLTRRTVVIKMAAFRYRDEKTAVAGIVIAEWLEWILTLEDGSRSPRQRTAVTVYRWLWWKPMKCRVFFDSISYGNLSLGQFSNELSNQDRRGVAPSVTAWRVLQPLWFSGVFASSFHNCSQLCTILSSRDVLLCLPVHIVILFCVISLVFVPPDSSFSTDRAVFWDLILGL